MNLTKLFKNRLFLTLSITLLSATTFFTGIAVPNTILCHAENDPNAEMEANKFLPIQSNDVENWPQGPAIGAKSAILMEMNTHTILYAKNIHDKMYPASTTKIITCLIAMQNCSLDEDITFSHRAIYDVPVDGSKLGRVDEGDTLNMEKALYSVLVQSANEVASAVGEHVAEKLGKEKSQEAFAEIMNEKAKSLGCLNSHFVNANGLFDENHYTTAYDLGLIGCEFFNNELLCKMSSSPNYHFKLMPDDEEDTWISSKNQLYKGKPYQYEYLLGSKTGFVSQSRQTLVSGAEKNGMKLVCVILSDETPYQFEDTITLFQYGFENFKKMTISENETKYKVNNMDLFSTENDLFGDSTPLIAMEEDKYIILPNTAEFADASSTLTYHNSKEDEDSNIIATIHYTYSDVPVGDCDIIFSKSETPSFNFAPEMQGTVMLGNPKNNAEKATDSSTESAAENEKQNKDEKNPSDKNPNGTQKVIFINVKTLVIGILALAGAAILITAILSVINSYSFTPRGQSSRRRRQRKHESRIAKRNARWQARRTARAARRELRKRSRSWKRL